MERPRRFQTKKLEDLNDDELEEFLAAATSGSDDDGDFSSGDEFNDPDYFPDEITDENNEQPEDLNPDAAEASGIIDAVNLSLNISPPATEPVASTSSFKAPKRPRSPLPSVEASGPKIVPSAGGFTGNIGEINKNSDEFAKITWQQKSMKLHVNEVSFRGKSGLPAAIKNMFTPMEIFNYFFTDDIIQIIVEETNRAAENTGFHIDPVGIRHFIGVLLYMSLYHYPNVRSYWGKNAFTPIQTTMTVYQFKQITQYLSFQDESRRLNKGQPGYDPLFRIRHFAEALNKRFDSIPKTARLCIDEQMCSTKMKHHLRQYMPNKPHKWGIKLFVLCDSHGFAYKFEIYNGAGDNVVLPGTPDLSSSANVVVRLTQTVKDSKHHNVYFDNFYTSLPLLVYLRARGIYALGTMRSNRIPNCMLPLDKSVANEQRGFSIEYTGMAYGVDMITVLWKDNKCVRLASTYVGIERFQRANPDKQVAKAPRFDRKQKKYVEVDCPQIIREYNSHMGGVDLMDGLIGRYHVRVKSCNPMTRLFYHLIDLAATNSYILYRRIHAENGMNTSASSAEGDDLFQLPRFREEIAAGLVALVEKRPVGRPSTSTPAPPPTQTGITTGTGIRAKHPVGDLRYDGHDHFPSWLNKSGGKKSVSTAKCHKPNVSANSAICTYAAQMPKTAFSTIIIENEIIVSVVSFTIFFTHYSIKMSNKDNQST